MTREIVVISGKGGTGKTSVSAALASLAAPLVVADCDVDAADLHLLLSPEIKEKYDFTAGHQAVIRQEICRHCALCREHCRFEAIRMSNDLSGQSNFTVDPVACEGCGLCVEVCPAGAVDFPECHCGEWMISDTRCGPMVHARLGVAADNSGKLVFLVRQKARRIAEEQGYPLVVVDGPPGTGCPVIASITGAALVLIVSEPTVSGEHDLSRVLSLAGHFGIPASVCVNKWDLNPEMTKRIERHAESMGASVAGRIRYDKTVSLAQIKQQTAVEMNLPVGEDIKKIWETISFE